MAAPDSRGQFPNLTFRVCLGHDDDFDVVVEWSDYHPEFSVEQLRRIKQAIDEELDWAIKQKE
jgi:hypothetical protein